LVGLIKIQVKNGKNGLLQKWDLPSGYSAPRVTTEQTERGRYFILTGDNSEYKVALRIVYK
jgi:Ribonuclease G/E